MSNNKLPTLKDGTGFSDISKKGGEDEPGEIRTSCGWFSWRPSCLRCFASPRWLLATICAYVFFQSMAVNGLVDGSLASLQRRFELSSFQTGLLPALYDVVAAVLGVLLAYAGNKRNKARLLTMGTIFIGIGNVVYALPHFTTGLYAYSDDNSTDTCRSTGDDLPTAAPDDKSTIAALSGYLGVFILSQVLFGIGGTMGYSIGFAFVDESVTSKMAGMYLGILSACATLGPALGLVIAGVLLSLYTDFHAIEGGLTIDPSSEQWVGAWWLGFIFTALTSVIIAVPLSCFPHELPDTQTIREQRESQAHAMTDRAGKTSHEHFGKSWRDFPAALKVMLKNPTFMAVAISQAADGLLLTGVGTFLPIYLENQYGLSSGTANIIVGAQVCTAGCGSLFLGGWLLKRFRLKVRGMLRFIMIVITANALSLLTVFLTCPEIPLAGVYQHYANDSSISVVHLDDPCNDGCQCSTTPYSPVCGSNDVMYFSPCFAGCQAQVVGDKTVYTDCTCVSTYNNSSDSTAVPGRCGTYCTRMYILIGCLFIITATTFLDRVAAVNAVLRCIPDGQQSFGLGMYGFISRLFGSLPGPIIFGSIIDATCTLWHEEGGRRGQCWFHNRSDLSLYLVLFALALKTTAFISTFVGYKLYRPPESDEEPQTEGECLD
ncbi:solute carrier organic anion transporter family member 4A1-like isoform X2 [Acanthaster planci]|uniref:Solute carrier organic anion transporter family member n=1 Tax=Acanthaster planci TaxID=133434 RepID=A0A8B7XPU9_ACAPL|nr:solute carrier organic anion transporter family member 4A1-like isoform X2 [Acanthaster planci]